MHIQINPQSGTPIYQQIVSQVRHLVGCGRLRPGEEMLPIRALAEQLAINPNTVVRAYHELEQSGILYKRQGMGTYISEKQAFIPRREAIKTLSNSVDEFLAEAAFLGLDLNAVLEIVKDRHKALKSQALK